MKNYGILDIALRQSAYDYNCKPEDFMKEANVVVLSKAHPKARCYLSLPLECSLVSYGSNIVAQASSQLTDIVTSYINKYPVEHCFETPNMHILNESLEKHGLKICFMAEYFLPDITKLQELPCAYKLKILHSDDFKDLYTKDWSNALCEKRKDRDILGIGAYDNDRLIALAGCSADCEMMWQIGIDVLPPYRKKGIAAALTSRLALLVLEQGKVPFYCAAWSNIKSVRNAVKCGFKPAWVEMTARSCKFVEEMNQ